MTRENVISNMGFDRLLGKIRLFACFLCLVSCVQAQDALFAHIDSLAQGEERADALGEIYTLYYRFTKHHQALETRYPSEEVFLANFPKQHAEVLLGLSGVAYFKEDDALYASRKAEALALFPDSMFVLETRFQDADHAFKSGNLKGAEEQLLALEPKVLILSQEKDFQPFVIIYYAKLISVFFTRNERESLLEKRAVVNAYMKNHYPEADPRSLRLISNLNSLAFLLEAQRNEYFRSIQLWMEMVEEGWIQPEDIEKNAGSFYLIGSAVYTLLGDEKNADRFQKTYEQLVENGTIEDNARLQVLLSTQDIEQENWEEMAPRLKQMEAHFHQAPRRYGLVYFDWLDHSTIYHVHMGHQDTASLIGQQYLEHAKEMGNPMGMFQAYFLMGKNAINRGAYEEAIPYLDMASDIALELEYFNKQTQCLKEKVRLYDEWGNLEGKSTAQEALIAHNELHQITEKDKQVALTYMEESEAKIQELRELKKKGEEVEAMEKKYTWLILTLGGVVGLIFLWFQGAKRRQIASLKEKMGTLEKEKNTLNQIQEDGKLRTQTLHKTVKTLIHERQPEPPSKDSDSLPNEEEGYTVLIESFPNNQAWMEFVSDFQRLDPHFLASLLDRYPNLSPTFQKHALCLKKGMSIKETAELLHISANTVKSVRYRMKQQLELSPGENLRKLIQLI